MRTSILLTLGFIILTSTSLVAGPRMSLSADSIQVLRISGQDRLAVVKMPDEKTAVLKPNEILQAGDKEKSLPELRVLEIAAGKIVLEERMNSDVEKIIIRFIDGKQTLERLTRKREQPPLMFAPATVRNTSD